MRKLISTIILTICCATINAQDIGLSQFFETPMLRNPSLAGLFEGDWRVGGVYRTQWNSVTTPYLTKAASGSLKLAAGSQTDGYFSLGAQFVTDKAGDLALTRNQFLFAPTYHLYLGNTENSYLSGSIMIGSIQSYFNKENAQLDDQFVNGSYSPSNPSSQPFNNSNYSYFDISAGMTLSGQLGNGDYYLGGALFHANRMGVKNDLNSFFPIRHKWVINGGISAPVNGSLMFKGYADYTLQSGNNQLFFGGMFEFLLSEAFEDITETKFALGAFYRLNDAVIPYVKLQWQRFSIGFSIDKTVSQLNSAATSANSMEFTLSYTGIFKDDRSSLKRSRCPKFGGSSFGWFSTK